MNLHRSLAPTAVRCRILQVWGWTVPTDPIRTSSPWVPDPPSVGVDSSQVERDVFCVQVPDPPSVGVDSSIKIGFAKS